jgi:hypothetical protein
MSEREALCYVSVSMSDDSVDGRVSFARQNESEEYFAVSTSERP